MVVSLSLKGTRATNLAWRSERAESHSFIEDDKADILLPGEDVGEGCERWIESVVALQEQNLQS